MSTTYRLFVLTDKGYHFISSIRSRNIDNALLRFFPELGEEEDIDHLNVDCIEDHTTIVDEYNHEVSFAVTSRKCAPSMLDLIGAENKKAQEAEDDDLCPEGKRRDEECSCVLHQLVRSAQR